MILIVEDNPNARQLLARILSRAGHDVIESGDGEDALHLLDTQSFDLVITDLALPKTTGFGLISHIRLKWPRLPVILVTGYLSPDAGKKILDEFIEFIPKPIDRNRLIATVNRFVPGVR
jgi:two-component system response regulator FlrC